MFGARNTYALINPFIANLRQRMHFAYLQDDFKATERLTLNLGLRYEFATPQWEKDNFLTNFDPATNTLIQAKDGSIYDRALVNPDRNNFAPRLGLAYAIDRPDRPAQRLRHELHPLQPARRREPALLQRPARRRRSTSRSSRRRGSAARPRRRRPASGPTQQGYPEGLNVPANFSTLNARVNYIPKDNPTGNVQSWHVSVQRELLPNLLVDVGYVGNKSRDIMILGDYNQARPNGPTENATLQARRPIPGFQEIQIAFGGGKGDYHALQVKVERRYSRGLYLLNSFTWSRARDNASGHLEVQNGDNSRVNYRDIERRLRQLGLRPAVQQHDQLRVGAAVRQGRRFGSDLNPVVDGMLGGWRAGRHQHDDERRADQPVVHAGGALLGQRQPDLPAQPDRRSVTPSDSGRSTTT